MIRKGEGKSKDKLPKMFEEIEDRLKKEIEKRARRNKD